MPSTRTEKKIAEIRNDPKKRQRPAVEELAQEGQNERAKRVRTSEAEGQLNARRETVRKRQTEAEVSKSQVATRRSTRQTKSTKNDQPRHAKRISKQVYPQGFTGKADNISVAEVAEMVKRLNAEIEQVSSLLTDSLSSRRLPGFGGELGMEINDYLGAELCNELQRRSNKVNMEPGPLITQITLRTGLVNACSRIIMIIDRNHPSWANDPTISRIVSNTERAAVAANTRKDYMTRAVSLRENLYEKYLTEVLLKLITTVGAVGGSPQSNVTLPSLEGIIRQAIELQKVINKDVTSTGLVTYTVSCDQEFDPSQMEDVKWDSDEIATAPLGRVACTVEMGLRCRQRVDSGSGIGVVVKPKVVLAATLAACYTTSEKNLQQLLQKNAEKFSSMEVEANRRNEDHARDIARLEAMIAELKQLVQGMTTELRDIESTANERVQAKGVQRRQAATGLRDISVQEEQTHKPSTSVRKPDSISVAEVAELVRILNAQIEQVSILVADSLSYNETLNSGEVRIALDGLDDRVGQWLYSNLWSRSERQMEPDPLITQLAIQTGLVNVCCGIVNGSTLLINGYSDVAGTRITNAPRARVHSQNDRKESLQNYLMELLLKLITAARGSPETLHSQYSQKMEDITTKAIELHKLVSQDVTSVELSTYTIPCDTSFDPSQMEDTEGEGDVTGSVVCTLDMGLRCRKKVVHAKQNWIEGDVTMKAKVVLAATLETEIPK